MWAESWGEGGSAIILFTINRLISEIQRVNVDFLNYLPIYE